MNLRGATLSNWVAYTLCNVGVSLGTLPFTLFLLYYMTQIAGVPAGLAGIVIALPKIWDALVDPMFGGWIDRYSVRIGRRGPAIAFSAILFAGSIIAIFSLPSGLETWQIATLAFVLLVVSSIAQTGIGVSQFALAPEMTKSPVELSTLLAMAAVTAQVFSVGGSFAIPLLVSTGSGQAAYTKMAVAVAVAILIAFFLFVVGTRDVPVRPSTETKEAASIWTSLRATLENATFYNLLGLVVCLNCSIALTFGFLPFANQYVLNGSGQTLVLLEGILGVTVLLGLMLAPLLVRRIPPLRVMMVCNLLGALTMASLFVAQSLPFPLILGQLGLVGITSGVVGVLIQTSLLDAAQRPLRDGSVVTLGVYLGIMVAAIKLGASAGALVSGQLLHAVGFVGGAKTQSALALLGVRLGYSIVPALFVLAAILFLLRTMAVQRSPAVRNSIDLG